jgi:Ca-activated chloride channel family protein
MVSGSENESLETMIKDLGRKNGLDIALTYLGSVDIARELNKGAGGAYDVVWPVSTLWIALGDTQHVVKHSKSIICDPQSCLP